MSENISQFIDAFSQSLSDATFVKATLGNYKGSDEHLQKINIRTIETKKGVRLFFLYKYDTRDTAKNYDVDEGLALIANLLGKDFRNGHLFTLEHNYQLETDRKGVARLHTAKATFQTKNTAAHDREKRQLIDPNASYLNALGITTGTGDVRDKQQAKWRQINKFVEILTSLIEKSQLKDRRSLKIVDMGAGKGYLTFAAYDYLKNGLGIEVEMVGVEMREHLVTLCNDIAAASDFDGLRFVEGSIDSYEIGEVDILIALHACDTATDDALFKGIVAKASLIVAAPCCHQQIRPQITPPAYLRDVLKHGVLLERTAETITDGLRSLLLERSGYAVKMIDFVPVEHTPKNNMLVGTRLDKTVNTDQITRQINDLKTEFGIRKHQLEDLLTHGNRPQMDADAH